MYREDGVKCLSQKRVARASCPEKHWLKASARPIIGIDLKPGVFGSEMLNDARTDRRSFLGVFGDLTDRRDDGVPLFGHVGELILQHIGQQYIVLGC